MLSRRLSCKIRFYHPQSRLPSGHRDLALHKVQCRGLSGYWESLPSVQGRSCRPLSHGNLAYRTGFEPRAVGYKALTRMKSPTPNQVENFLQILETCGQPLGSQAGEVGFWVLRGGGGHARGALSCPSQHGASSTR